MIKKIRKISKKYNSKFVWKPNSGIFIIIYYLFILQLPHIIPSLILIILVPSKWIGILILGVFLSDFHMALYNLIRYPLPKIFKKIKHLNISKISKITHNLLFLVILIMILYKEYIIALSGLLHLIIDWLGF